MKIIEKAWKKFKNDYNVGKVIPLYEEDMLCYLWYLIFSSIKVKHNSINIFAKSRLGTIKNKENMYFVDLILCKEIKPDEQGRKIAIDVIELAELKFIARDFNEPECNTRVNEITNDIIKIEKISKIKLSLLKPKPNKKIQSYILICDEKDYMKLTKTGKERNTKAVIKFCEKAEKYIGNKNTKIIIYRKKNKHLEEVDLSSLRSFKTK